MKKTIALILMAASMAATAKSQSEEPTYTEGGIISSKIVQRVMIFESSRNWWSSDGHVLVCPYAMIVDFYEKGTCSQKGDEDKRTRWVKLEDLKIPGFEQVGFEYRMHGSGGYQRLFVYFGKPQPKPVATPVLPATNNITLKVENLTIETKTVRIQRKKK